MGGKRGYTRGIVARGRQSCFYAFVWVDQQRGMAPEGGRGFPFACRDGCPLRRRRRVASLSLQATIRAETAHAHLAG